jgi:cytochrome c556
MRRFLRVASIVVLLGAYLSGCGTAAPKVDICKQIMQIIGAFTDAQLEFLSDPESIIADASKTVEELNQLASTLPTGPEKDYVEVLATDYALFLKSGTTMEATFALLASLTPEKIAIVCPK